MMYMMYDTVIDYTGTSAQMEVSVMLVRHMLIFKWPYIYICKCG